MKPSDQLASLLEERDARAKAVSLEYADAWFVATLLVIWQPLVEIVEVAQEVDEAEFIHFGRLRRALGKVGETLSAADRHTR